MDTKSQHEIVDPLNGEVFIKVGFVSSASAEACWQSPNTQKDELEPFIESMNKCPKSGLHNMMKNTGFSVLFSRAALAH